MHVLLVQPPNDHQVWAGVPDKFMKRGFHDFPPLQIMYLSAYLKKYTGHRVTMLDCQHDGLGFEDIKRRITEIGPDIVCTSSNTHIIYDVWQVVQAAKAVNPKMPVVMGGSHVFSFPKEAIALPGVDYAIKGDGELTLTELLDALENQGDLSRIDGLLYHDGNGGIVQNAPRAPFRDLDELPFPDREGLSMDGYFTAGMEEARCTTLVSSRGCPYSCPFCSTYSTFRTRSPKNVVDELEACLRMGIKEVYFVDDVFNLPEKRLRDISDEIIARNVKIKWATKVTCSQMTYQTLARVKQSGCVRLHFGVETGTDEGQRSIGKKTSDLDQVRRVFAWCRELGIKTAAYMMLGIPYEKNEADILKSADFVDSLNPTFVIWALYSPYPDTQLWQDGAKLGLWKGDEWRKHMLAPTPYPDIPTAWTEHMPMDEQIRIMNKLMFRFYSNPVRIARLVSNIHNPAEARRMFHSGVSVLRSIFRPVKLLKDGQPTPAREPARSAVASMAG